MKFENESYAIKCKMNTIGIKIWFFYKKSSIINNAIFKYNYLELLNKIHEKLLVYPLVQ